MFIVKLRDKNIQLSKSAATSTKRSDKTEVEERQYNYLKYTVNQKANTIDVPFLILTPTQIRQTYDPTRVRRAPRVFIGKGRFLKLNA